MVYNAIMISFNQLGNLGRLGNQMFQYASLKGIAAHRGYEFCVPPKEMFGTKDSAVKRDLNLYDVFHLDGRNRVCTTTNRVLGEKMHTFDEDLFNHCPDNIDLFGYYQTDRYFRHIEAEIRGDFAFDAELQSDCEKMAKAFRVDLIALHVRRGDYVGNPNHPVQPLDYYKQALGRLPPNLPVLVFSDDCEWCLAQDLFKQNRFVISQNSSVAQDLCMMALWHDESHMNRYLIDHPPTVILPPAYCFAEEHVNHPRYPDRPKIIALQKNHNECRS